MSRLPGLRAPKAAPSSCARRLKFFRPRLEILEGRRLPALIQFGGQVLKETFDDLPSSAINLNSVLDDPGYLNGTAVGTVFHHVILGDAGITPGGDTTPTTQPPGQTAQELQLEQFAPGGATGNDSITIQPYLPAGAASAEVDLVSIDVKSGQVVVYGKNGQEIQTAPAATAFTTVSASSNDIIATDAAGHPVPLGPITQVHIIASGLTEYDNLRAVVFFPGISTPPVAKDDVYALPAGAAAGQTFTSGAIALTGDALGRVLVNDQASTGASVTARPLRLPGMAS
jgi:hypothetical protein